MGEGLAGWKGSDLMPDDTEARRRTPEPDPADWFGYTSTLPGNHDSRCWRWHPACAYRAGRRWADQERARLRDLADSYDRELAEARQTIAHLMDGGDY